MQYLLIDFSEIFLQKLDHCGIAIFSAGTNIPVSFLLLYQTAATATHSHGAMMTTTITSANALTYLAAQIETALVNDSATSLEKLNMLYYMMYVVVVSIVCSGSVLCEYLWYNYGVLLAVLSTVSCCWACWNTFALRPGSTVTCIITMYFISLC